MQVAGGTIPAAAQIASRTIGAIQQCQARAVGIKAFDRLLREGQPAPIGTVVGLGIVGGIGHRQILGALATATGHFNDVVVGVDAAAIRVAAESKHGAVRRDVVGIRVVVLIGQRMSGMACDGAGFAAVEVDRKQVRFAIVQKMIPVGNRCAFPDFGAHLGVFALFQAFGLVVPAC